MRVTLSLEAGASEFRIFKEGANDTTKGVFLFDDAAARAVFSAYMKHNVDVMIDLEHLSLEPAAPNFNPDALGWCKLELRGGELWAVDVKWTSEGARRLAAKTQRYISPAFEVDAESGRVMRLLNIALTAMPATDEATALVAANERAALGPYPWDECMADQLAAGYDEETAKKICGKIKAEYGRTLSMMSDADKAILDGLKTAAVDAMNKAEDVTVKAAMQKIADMVDSMVAGTAEVEVEQQESSTSTTQTEALSRRLSTIVGAKSTDELEAHVVALCETRRAFDALKAEVAAMKLSEEKREVEALIATNASKLTASLRAWAVSQKPAALRAFFAAAPEVVEREHHEPARTETIALSVSDEELRVAALFGQTEKDILAFKSARK